MQPEILPDDRDTGVLVADPIQKRQYPLSTPSPVTPESASTDRFHFPVETAATITTAGVSLPSVVPTFVRERDGEMLAQAGPNETHEFPDGEYLVELSAPVKLLLLVDSSLRVEATEERLDLSFGERTTVTVGARSYHDQPAGTVTVTSDPRDIMAAVSLFGSALKTTSPERSWPTLRGYPPTVELGDHYDAPGHLEPPDTDVTIGLPPDYRYIFPAATLAYYLGATVEPAADPVLRTGTSAYRFEDGDGFDDHVHRTLKQVFFLDCVVRTGGLYDVDLVERDYLQQRVDVPVPELYGQPLADRLERYLEVPYGAIEDLVPKWRLGVVATADPENAAALPHVVNDLGLVRTWTPRPGPAPPSPELSAAVEEFARSGSASGPPNGSPSEGDYVDPDHPEAIERAWLGSGIPLSGGKLLREGYENGLREHTEVDSVIRVVCNDPSMSEEYTDGPLYGDREKIDLRVHTYRELSVVELRDLLYEECDFLHYIGHAEDGKFVCSDGHLDPAELSTVGVDAFLLNGCRSYEMGVDLVRAGSSGGIVTFQAVGNEPAIRIGQHVARLLNEGFTLAASLSIADDRQLVGDDYLVVGDGSAEIAQSASGTPVLCRLEPLSSSEYEVTFVTYPTVEKGTGSIYQPYLDHTPPYHLNGGSIGPFVVSAEEVRSFFRLDDRLVPVLLDGELRWSSELSL